MVVNNNSEVSEDLLVKWTSASLIKPLLLPYEGLRFESTQGHKFILSFFLFVFLFLAQNKWE